MHLAFHCKNSFLEPSGSSQPELVSISYALSEVLLLPLGVNKGSLDGMLVHRKATPMASIKSGFPGWREAS